MKKVITLLVGLLAAVGLVLIPSTAIAAPAKVTVTPGQTIDYGKDGFICTLGVVGTDKFGNLVGISAGHCLTAVGTQVFAPGKRDLGPIGVTVASNGGPNYTATGLDYSVVKYDASKVVLDADGPGLRVDGIAPNPGFGAYACKSGTTTGRQCGFLTTRDQYGNVLGWIWTLPGDSGGPVATGTKWVGLTSKLNFDLAGPVAFVSAQKIVADLNAKNSVGAGLVLATA